MVQVYAQQLSTTQHVSVELTDASGQLCSHKQDVTAKLEPKLSPSKTNDSGWWLWSGKSQTTPGKPLVTVSAQSPSRYHIAYTAAIRGQHRLHIQLNSREVSSSPFNITVYPDPTQLGAPVRVLTGLNHPYRVATNSRGELLVSEWGSHQVSILNAKGNRIGSYGYMGHEPENMWHPTGIAIDDDGNVFVASHHKLQKFSPGGQLMKSVGQKGEGEGEFWYPLGITFHSNRVYVCDEDNGRIQVFDTDLTFKQSIGSCCSGTGQFLQPHDVKFDKDGNMYVVEYQNNRVQVVDESGHFLRMFGHVKGAGELLCPTALYIADQLVYVSDSKHYRTAVYQTSGQFVASFGKLGEREFYLARGITSDSDGMIYVCDKTKNCINVF